MLFTVGVGISPQTRFRGSFSLGLRQLVNEGCSSVYNLDGYLRMPAVNHRDCSAMRVGSGFTRAVSPDVVRKRTVSITGPVVIRVGDRVDRRTCSNHKAPA